MILEYVALSIEFGAFPNTQYKTQTDLNYHFFHCASNPIPLCYGWLGKEKGFPFPISIHCKSYKHNVNDCSDLSAPSEWGS